MCIRDSFSVKLKITSTRIFLVPNTNFFTYKWLVISKFHYDGTKCIIQKNIFILSLIIYCSDADDFEWDLLYTTSVFDPTNYLYLYKIGYAVLSALIIICLFILS